MADGSQRFLKLTTRHRMLSDDFAAVGVGSGGGRRSGGWGGRRSASGTVARTLLGTVLLVYVAYADGISSETEEPSTGIDEFLGEDFEEDFAPFMIVVEHPDGARCSGSLLSLRTALTSAWCVRGGAGAGAPIRSRDRAVAGAHTRSRDRAGAAPRLSRDLWALAAAAATAPPPAAAAARRQGARRISRIAVAADADADAEDGESGSMSGEPSWRGGVSDLAVVELERPFGIEAQARPVVVAINGEGCEPNEERECHVVRALPRAHSRRLRLVVVGARLVAPAACAAAARHWSAVRDRALCLVGSRLCPTDWGAGIVCSGKLCGVLSRSVGDKRVPGERGCGATHVAQSVARWGAFLHCTNNLPACGRGGKCADVCVDEQLIDDARKDTTVPAPSARTQRSTWPPLQSVVSRTRTPGPMSPSPETQKTGRAPSRTKKINILLESDESQESLEPPRGRGTGASVSRPDISALDEGTQITSLPHIEFEPNRADFKAAPSRSTRVYFKAGEYGDNAADYGAAGEYAPAPAPTDTTQHAPPRPPPPAPPRPHTHPLVSTPTGHAHALTESRQATNTPDAPPPHVSMRAPLHQLVQPTPSAAPPVTSVLRTLLLLLVHSFE